MVRPDIRVATQTQETVDAIHAALDARRPIVLLHAKLPEDEHMRQRAMVEAATFSDDDAVVLFTSGSTQSARGVVLSRAAIDAAAEATWQHIGRRENDAWLCTLPLAHTGGLSIVVRCRAAGIPCVLADRVRARARVTCTSTSATPASAVPTLASAVPTLASVVPTQLDELEPSPSLRAVFVGGAAASPSAIDAAIARGIPALPTYGLTETFGMVATAKTPGGPLVPLPGVTITAGPPDAPALVRIRAPQLASRYLDGTPIAPELTTSDLGFLDEHGHLHIVGRADDVIITGGENVHPAQVEAVLLATPGVRAAVVFGVPDTRWGQLVAAALATDEQFDRTAALARWHAQLPPYARPRRLVTLDDLPRLPSGKLDRRQAAALATSAIEYA